MFSDSALALLVFLRPSDMFSTLLSTQMCMHIQIKLINLQTRLIVQAGTDLGGGNLILFVNIYVEIFYLYVIFVVSLFRTQFWIRPCVQVLILCVLERYGRETEL